MRRGDESVYPVVDPEHDGLEKEQMAKDLIGVLTEPLEELIVLLAKGLVQSFVSSNEGKEYRASWPMAGDRQGFDSEGSQEGEHRRSRLDVVVKPFGQ